MDSSGLKADLRVATKPTLGRFGEKIYAMFMSELGHRVQSLHRDKADFIVSGLGRVDVKTRGFEKSNGRIAQMRSDTIYCFVDLLDECIVITHADSLGCTTLGAELLPWEKALAYWANHSFRLARANSELKNRILLQTHELRQWINVHWRLSAAIVYRQGRDTQRSMASGKMPWGPITFYEHPTAKRTIDLKVLMYFDEDIVYEIFAYPLERRDEIAWFKGRTNDRTISFDPARLAPDFVFSDAEDFKSRFLASNPSLGMSSRAS